MDRRPPWLVNAIARECVEKRLKNDFSKPVTMEMVEQAVQTLILRRDVHIDSLLERLREDRVRKVMEPVITGKENAVSMSSDDTLYCLDLGLVKIASGVLTVSNPIYREVFIRMLTQDTQFNLMSKIPEIPWLLPDGIDMNGLMEAFQEFWRENSEIWAEI